MGRGKHVPDTAFEQVLSKTQPVGTAQRPAAGKQLLLVAAVPVKRHLRSPAAHITVQSGFARAVQIGQHPRSV